MSFQYEVDVIVRQALESSQLWRRFEILDNEDLAYLISEYCDVSVAMIAIFKGDKEYLPLEWSSKILGAGVQKSAIDDPLSRVNLYVGDVGVLKNTKDSCNHGSTFQNKVVRSIYLMIRFETNNLKEAEVKRIQAKKEESARMMPRRKSTISVAEGAQRSSGRDKPMRLRHQAHGI